MNHSDRSHAPLSPSRAKQWLNCHGSLFLSKGLTSVAGPAAIWGTEVHQHADKILHAKYFKAPSATEEEIQALLELVEDEEQREYARSYTSFISKISDEFVKGCKSYKRFLEGRVALTEHNYGTLDYAIVADRKGGLQAMLADLKTGGLIVPAEECEQLINYLLCLDQLYEGKIEKAYLFIYQPKRMGEPYDVWTLTKEAKHKWKARFEEGSKKALAMLNGELEPEYKAGEWCRFCPANGRCPHQKTYVNEGSLAILEEHVLPDPSLLTVEQRVAIEKKKKMIEDFLEKVSISLQQDLEAGKAVPGYKLVEGRSNRKWLDDVEAVGSALKKLGFKKPFRQKLVTIGDVEDKLGKGKINHLTMKPPGKPQLAADSDKREAIKSSTDLLEEFTS